MNYKSGIIFYKIKNNKYYFLLSNNNIFLSNKSKDLFNAVGYKFLRHRTKTLSN